MYYQYIYIYKYEINYVTKGILLYISKLCYRIVCHLRVSLLWLSAKLTLAHHLKKQQHG